MDMVQFSRDDDLLQTLGFEVHSSSGNRQRVTLVSDGVFLDLWERDNQVQAKLTAFVGGNPMLQLVTPSFMFPHKFFQVFFRDFQDALKALQSIGGRGNG